MKLLDGLARMANRIHTADQLTEEKVKPFQAEYNDICDREYLAMACLAGYGKNLYDEYIDALNEHDEKERHHLMRKALLKFCSELEQDADALIKELAGEMVGDVVV